MDEYIKILELSDSFDIKDLKKAYRKMAMKYHPDFAKTDAEKISFNEKMKKINEANDALKEYLNRHGKYTKTKTNNSSNTQKTNSSSNSKTSSHKSNSNPKYKSSYFQSNHKTEPKNNYKTYNGSFMKKNIYKKEPDNINWKGAFVLCMIVFLCVKCVSPNNDNATVQATPPVQEAVQEDLYNEEQEYQDEYYQEQEDYEEETPEPVTEPVKPKSVTPKPTVQKSEAPKKTTQPSVQLAQVRNKNQEFLDYKRDCLIRDTDLGQEQPRINTESGAARKYANKYITPKIQETWQKQYEKPQNDNMTFSVYIDLYGQLRYIKITSRANYIATEQAIREALNYSTFPDLYYVNLGGDVKITYNVTVENGNINLQVIKASNLIW